MIPFDVSATNQTNLMQPQQVLLQRNHSTVEQQTQEVNDPLVYQENEDGTYSLRQDEVYDVDNTNYQSLLGLLASIVEKQVTLEARMQANTQ